MNKAAVEWMIENGNQVSFTLYHHASQ